MNRRQREVTDPSYPRETHWLADLDDINRLRRFAFRHHLGDSIITIKRLLDIAEEAERRGLLGEHATIKACGQ